MKTPTWRPFPSPRVLAVDVDGTLSNRGNLNADVLAFVRRRRAEGFGTFLWSMRGEVYARAAAEAFGCAGDFDHIIGKPGFVLDDQGLLWLRETQIVRDLTR